MTQQEIQNRIRQMPVYSTLRFLQHETRMDHEYLYAADKMHSELVKLSDIACFHALRYVDAGTYYKFRIITHQNRTVEFQLSEKNWAAKLFTDLERACPSFRSTPSTFTPWTHTEQNCIHYHLDRSGLTIRQTYPNATESKRFIPAQDIRWCEMVEADTSDGGGIPFYLELHLADGKHYTLYGWSAGEMYEIALAFKDNIPHLVYGLNIVCEGMLTPKPPTLLQRIRKLF